MHIKLTIASVSEEINSERQNLKKGNPLFSSKAPQMAQSTIDIKALNIKRITRK